MSESLPAALAEVLRAEKAAQRLTIRELTERTGLDKSTIDRNLNERVEISVAVLGLFADAFGLLPSKLMERAEERSRNTPPNGGADVIQLPRR